MVPLHDQGGWLQVTRRLSSLNPFPTLFVPMQDICFSCTRDVKVRRMVGNVVLNLILGATLEMWYSEFNCSILISMWPSRLSVLVTGMEAVKFRNQLIQDLQEEILKGQPDNLSCILFHDSFQLVFVPHK